MFKILKGYENIHSNIFFEIKQSRLDVRKFSFSQRTINVWNKLSTECVHASSVNVFKNIIDKYLVNPYMPKTFFYYNKFFLLGLYTQIPKTMIFSQIIAYFEFLGVF